MVAVAVVVDKLYRTLDVKITIIVIADLNAGCSTTLTKTKQCRRAFGKAIPTSAKFYTRIYALSTAQAVRVTLSPTAILTHDSLKSWY